MITRYLIFALIFNLAINGTLLCIDPLPFSLVPQQTEKKTGQNNKKNGTRTAVTNSSKKNAMSRSDDESEFEYEDDGFDEAPSHWQRIKKWVRRHRLLTATCAIVCVATGAYFGGFFEGWPSIPATPEDAQDNNTQTQKIANKSTISTTNSTNPTQTDQQKDADRNKTPLVATDAQVQKDASKLPPEQSASTTQQPSQTPKETRNLTLDDGSSDNVDRVPTLRLLTIGGIAAIVMGMILHSR